MKNIGVKIFDDPPEFEDQAEILFILFGNDLKLYGEIVYNRVIYQVVKCHQVNFVALVLLFQFSYQFQQTPFSAAFAQTIYHH
jgi:hypothetical protein